MTYWELHDRLLLVVALTLLHGLSYYPCEVVIRALGA